MALSVELLLLILAYGFLNGGGIILVRIGFNKTERKGVNLASGKFVNQIKLMYQEFLQMIRIKVWVVGAGLMIAGFLVFQISLKNFSISDVRPLSNINIVFVVLFSKLIFKEKLKIKEALGVVISLCALIIISYTAQESTNILIPANFNFSLIVLGIVTFFALLGLYVFKFKYEYMSGVLNGAVFSIGSIANKAFLTEISESGNNIYFIFQSEFFYIFLVAYGLGIFTSLVLLSTNKGRVSVMTLVSNMVSLIMIVTFSIFIFEENLLYLPSEMFNFPISLLKISGIILAGISLILLYTPTRNL